MQPPAESEPTVLGELLNPLGRCLTPDVARALVSLRAEPHVQARIEALADRSTEGELSAEEQDEYRTYVQAIEFIGVLQSKARALLAAEEHS